MALREREFTSVEYKRVSYLTEWIAGVIGGLATIVGLWMYHGPADGVLQLFAWDWGVAELSVAWPLSLIIVGTLLLAGVFARLSTRMASDGRGNTATTYTALATISLLATVMYALIWIF